MVGDRRYAKERKLLNAISTLKRAAGIPNSATEKDGDYKELPTLFEIYVPDSQSADILANLFLECLMETAERNAKANNKKFDSEYTRAYNLTNVRIQKHGREFKVVLQEMSDSYLTLAQTINKKALSLIAPDKNPRTMKRPLGLDV
jgi:uncharacterized UPF0160 family protein